MNFKLRAPPLAVIPSGAKETPPPTPPCAALRFLAPLGMTVQPRDEEEEEEVVVVVVVVVSCASQLLTLNS
ncbi:MAG: hypothetical protein LBF67_02900 [Prevotellaceae bacterium]|nr:hypothetical protein [Prevotellaceae bacterium]